MFKQEYQTANDRIHAGDALLDRIRDGQGKQCALTRTVLWSAGGTLAAAAAVLAVLLIVPLSKSASPTAEAALPKAMDNGFALTAGEPETDSAYLETEESAMDMAVCLEAPAEEAETDAAEEPRVCEPVWLYKDHSMQFAIDDWFVMLSESQGEVLAASEEDGRWCTTDGLTLTLPALALLTDDDCLYAISTQNGDTLAIQYELSEGPAASLHQLRTLTQNGGYLDALLENNVLYLLTQADGVLRVGAANVAGDTGWQAECALSVQPDASKLYGTSDGVLLACQTDEVCRLYVLMNEPDGLILDAEGEQAGTLMYAYRTRSGNWHTIFDVDGVLTERILDDAFAVVSEQAMEFYADGVYCDEDGLLIYTYPNADNVLQVERYAVRVGVFYEPTGEVWRTDGERYLGEIVSWDDDDGVLYLLASDGLYAFDIRTQTASRIVDVS